jgi:hypothetical protein
VQITNRSALYLGLSFTLLATLLIEVVNTRLLSVLTWYHLSFLAISVAMLGSASGAVLVFTNTRLFDPERSATDLTRWSTAFAVALPLSHVFNLVIPVPSGNTWGPMDVVAMAVVIGVLTVPFVCSGIVVTLALTRTSAPPGTLYGFDLLGAATGTILAVALLNVWNVTSVALVASAAACASAAMFRAAAGRRPSGAMALAIAGLLLVAAVNGSREWLQVLYPKNRQVWSMPVARSLWNSHSHILVLQPMRMPAYYWGPDVHAAGFSANHAFFLVDGEAGSPMTEWNGRRESLDWVSHDVTALPHHLRRGHAGVIGVGGGRDILAAIWGGSTRVTGIEINSRILDVLTGSHLRFTKIANHEGVELVHDEARSYLSRHELKFDVLQMSLVDTWAATGAGAFTLSENGLYTVEGWQVFLERLAPRGIFSVSRWFAQETPTETRRLLALAVAALIEKGVNRPSDHLVLATRANVATLLVSMDRFSPEDLRAIEGLAGEHGLSLLAIPSAEPHTALAGIVRSRSREELDAVTRDDRLDFSPPDDSRPFFFNMLRPMAWLRGDAPIAAGGAIAGNLRATSTLMVLLGVTSGFVLLTILVPLAISGRPRMSGPAFISALLYFAAIGAGFMLTQVAFLQRFSVYLGHPTYTFAGVLFTMILFAGLGSFASGLLTGPRERLFLFIPGIIAAWLIVLGLALPRVLLETFHLSTPLRLAIVMAASAPLSFLLGFCYPFGARQVARLDTRAVAWMWGTNGAAGVLASVVAIVISIWTGIEVNFFIAAFCYACLTALAAFLRAQPSAG